jgi:hypothetical protein
MEFSKWILWYHDPEVRGYELKDYIKVADLTNVQQFWSVIDTIPKEAWECGMFFFMKNDCPPQWDAPQMENGGTWSKKIDAQQAHTSFVDLMVHCISDELLIEHKDTLAGISISPKGQFHIIKIWNTDKTKSSKQFLNQNLTYFRVTDDVTYTFNQSRPK